jgi:hypothetical protein
MEISMKTFLLLAALTVNIASAQQIDTYDSYSSADTARNTVLLELSTGLVTNSLSLNYEYQFHPNAGLRIGAGAAIQLEGANTAGATIGMQMYTDGDSRLEGGIGVSLLYAQSSAHLPAALEPAPAINIGYRYQPVEGGMMFRVGLSYSYNYGLPFQGSAGYAF